MAEKIAFLPKPDGHMDGDICNYRVAAILKTVLSTVLKWNSKAAYGNHITVQYIHMEISMEIGKTWGQGKKTKFPVSWYYNIYGWGVILG